jgi:hypothetical protein
LPGSIDEIAMHNNRSMKTYLPNIVLATCLSTGFGVSAEAANRVRAGQWNMSLNVAGRAITRSMCLSQSDANAINGDASSIKAYAERVSAPAGCKVTDVKINGNQVTVNSVCASGKENVGTTTYHGDSYETVNTNGAKSRAKWVGACN